MNRTARDSVLLTIGTGVTAALSMLYVIYVARRLEPALYSDFAAGVAVALFGSIALGPINGIVARFAAEYRGRGEIGSIRTLAKAINLRIIKFGIPLLVAACAASPWLAKALDFQSPLALITAFVVVYLTLTLSTFRGLLRGVQHFFDYTVNILAESGTRLVVGVLLLLVITHAVAALFAYAIALVIVLAISVVQVRRVWADTPAAPLDALAIRRFAGPMFLVMFVSAGFQNLDMLFVNRLFADETAGVFGAAFALSRGISVLVTPFNTLAIPIITTLHVQRQGVAKAFAKLCGAFLLLAALPLGLMWWKPDWIAGLVYEPAYADAATVLFPLALVRLAGSIAHMIALAYAAVNRFHFVPLYIGGVILETVWLIVGKPATPSEVVNIALYSQCAALAGMMLYLLQSYVRMHGNRRQSPVQD